MPHFAETPQVSFAFFSYRLAISIFGIQDKTREKSYLYLADKLQAGAKSSDHTISYFYQYVTKYSRKYFFKYLLLQFIGQ